MLDGARRFLRRLRLRARHRGFLALAQPLEQDYTFDGITRVLPTILFDERYVVPEEDVVFAGATILVDTHHRSPARRRACVVPAQAASVMERRGT